MADLPSPRLDYAPLREAMGPGGLEPGLVSIVAHKRGCVRVLHISSKVMKICQIFLVHRWTLLLDETLTLHPLPEPRLRGQCTRISGE